jgi:hypothetical protein
MLLAARVQLGRWPCRLGPDDPKDIPVVGEMHMVAVVGLLAMPFLVLAGVAGLLFILWHDPIRGLALIALIALLWLGLWALGDPTQVWVWFLD